MNKIVFAVLVALNICWSEQGSYSPTRMPRKCNGQVYCLWKGGQLYPKEDVITALSKSQIRNFGPFEDWCLGRAQDPTEMSECGKGKCGARIYYVKDLNNITRVVLQSDKKDSIQFKQLYDITECKTEGTVTSTDHLSKTSLKDHTMTCTTTYSEYNFHVLTLKGDGVEYIRARLPVCCKCTLKRK